MPLIDKTRHGHEFIAREDENTIRAKRNEILSEQRERDFHGTARFRWNYNNKVISKH